MKGSYNMGNWSHNNSWTIDMIIGDQREFNMDPPYQRSDNAWTTSQKEGLINSLILNYPIPPIYLVDRPNNESRYVVVDGKQRLKTIFTYLKKDSSKKVCNIDINIFKPLKSLRIKEGTNAFIYEGVGYMIEDTDQITTIDYNINDFKEPNIFQLRNLFAELEKITVSSAAINVFNLRDNLRFVQPLYAETINTYIGTSCTDEEELIVFRCLNAGSALNIYEHYNGMFSQYKMWEQAKTISHSISVNDRSKLYAAFLYERRCEDFKFWADILLTIFCCDKLRDVKVKTWKDGGPDIPALDAKVDENTVKRVKKIIAFMVNNVCEHIHKSKRTPKIQAALFLKFYYREKAHSDCYDFFGETGTHLANIISYINDTSLANKTIVNILNEI